MAMLSSALSSRSRSIWRVLAIVFAFLLLQHFVFFRQSSESLVWGDSQPLFRSSCDSVRKGLDNVQVILKTGANEAPQKLPIHFDTTLRCVPHYALYSDLQEEVAGHLVQNALEDMNPKVVASHPDFDYYRRLQQKGRESFTAKELTEWSSAKSTGGGKNSPGWRLDKWKFLPLADKALKLRPNAKWFVFIETDTFVIWNTLLEWLSLYDASKPYYLGQQMQIGDVIFAYGGSGFVLSNSALKKVVELRNSKLKYYDEYTGDHWAGDCVLGKALADADVGLHWSWPTLLSEQPVAMDFNDTFGGPDKKLWCYYAASYHHMSPGDIARLDEFQRKWNEENGTMLRHKDIFHAYILPQLSDEQIDWDNLSEGEEFGDTTLEKCKSACKDKPQCVQFSFSSRTCKLSTAIKLGHPTLAHSDRVTSGWLMDRVHAFVTEMDASCKDETFILP